MHQSKATYPIEFIGLDIEGLDLVYLAKTQLFPSSLRMSSISEYSAVVVSSEPLGRHKNKHQVKVFQACICMGLIPYDVCQTWGDTDPTQAMKLL